MCRRSARKTGQIDGMVIMIRDIVLVTVHGPQNVDFLAVRVAVIFDHLQLILD